MLGITMTNDGNIVDLGKAIEKAVAKVQAELPYGVELERVADQPTVVGESVWEFERSLLEALAIVLAVCLLSLGWRTGIVVGLSVPIAWRRRPGHARDGLESRARLLSGR
jgi:multidrug efflux pump subunit AcrB